VSVRDALLLVLRKSLFSRYRVQDALILKFHSVNPSQQNSVTTRPRHVVQCGVGWGVDFWSRFAACIPLVMWPATPVLARFLLLSYAHTLAFVCVEESVLNQLDLVFVCVCVYVGVGVFYVCVLCFYCTITFVMCVTGRWSPGK